MIGSQAIEEHTLASLLAALREKKLSPREATDACLARIRDWQSAINAFIAIEADDALAAADKVNTAGALAGAPLAHKDMFYRAGRIATCGSALRREWRADTTSSALAKLDLAGALTLGTLNMAEFAYGPTGHNDSFGHCRNPWNTDHLPGGSSSGSGAAVAARLVFGALGSDTGGSVRAPAGACGVTGLKVTWGRVSRAGVMPLSHTLDTVGPIAQTAEDCAILLAQIAGHDPADPISSREPVDDYVGRIHDGAKGLRIGVPSRWMAANCDAAVADALSQALKVLEHEGAILVEVDGPDIDALSDLQMIVMQPEASSLHANGLRNHRDLYERGTRARLEPGFAIPATAYLDALRLRASELDRFCTQTIAGVDVLATPVMAIGVPTLSGTGPGSGAAGGKAIGDVTRCLRWVNYLGVPAIALPAGFDDRGNAGALAGGLPVGLQLVSRPFTESLLLRIGHAFQRATDWHARRPSLPESPS